jgi:hypothetical protein
MSIHRPTAFIAIALTTLTLAACQSPEQIEEPAEEVPSINLVDVTVFDFAFKAPGQIPSGWTTLRMKNAGKQEHFALLQRLPEGKRIDDYGAEVGAVFGEVWERYSAGEIDRDGAGQALGEQLPEWFFTEIVPSGGVAITEPGATSESTVYLEPGIYVMECYVKNPGGQFHSMLGMMREITVTADTSKASPPDADVELTLSNYQIAASGVLTAGTRTVAVHVVDKPEGMMAHDINLFRLDESTDIDEIVEWMDWMDLEGFRAPAPGYSLGGVEHLPAGATGYMTVDFEPGRYAWVSEEYGARGVALEFTVE